MINLGVTPAHFEVHGSLTQLNVNRRGPFQGLPWIHRQHKPLFRGIGPRFVHVFLKMKLDVRRWAEENASKIFFRVR